MPLTKICKMSLKNQGVFTTRIMFSYLHGKGEKKLSGQSGTFGAVARKQPILGTWVSQTVR